MIRLNSKCKRRCIDCVNITRVNRYENFRLVSIGSGCKKQKEWSVLNPVGCKHYKCKLWKIFRFNHVVDKETI